MQDGRLKTGMLVVPVLMFIIGWSSISFFLFILAVIMLGLKEYFDLTDGMGFASQRFLGISGGIMLAAAMFIFDRKTDLNVTGIILSACFIAMFMLPLFRNESEKMIESVSITLGGIFYVSWTIAHAVLLRNMRPFGKNYVFLIFLSIMSINAVLEWVEGMKSKGRKKKAGTGTALGLAAAVAAGVVAVIVWQKAIEIIFMKKQDPSAELFPFIHTVIIGLLLGVFSQAGTFVKNALKLRSRNRHDVILPGYGDVIDMMSSFQFCVPVMYYYVKLLLT